MYYNMPNSNRLDNEEHPEEEKDCKERGGSASLGENGGNEEKNDHDDVECGVAMYTDAVSGADAVQDKVNETIIQDEKKNVNGKNKTFLSPSNPTDEVEDDAGNQEEINSDDASDDCDGEEGSSLNNNEEIDVDDADNDEKEDEAASDSESSSENGNDSSSGNSDVEEDGEGEGEGGLSRYEKLRLKRIKRNQERMAALGLDGANVMKPQPQRQKKTKSTPITVPARSSLSRRTKEKRVNYAADLLPLRSVLAAGFSEAFAEQSQTNDDQKTEGTPPNKQNKLELNVQDPGQDPAAAAVPQQNPKYDSSNNDNDNNISNNIDADGDADKSAKKKTRSHSTRMDLTIHREFVKIRSSKRSTLKLAQKLHSKAEREVRFWTKLADAQAKKRGRALQRKLEIHKRQAEKAALEEEMRIFGGTTKKDLLLEIDRRMPELINVEAKYESQLRMAVAAREMKAKLLLLEQRSQLTRDLEIEYPKALRGAYAVLDSVLQERAPKDPPPPRRSKRSGADDLEETHKRKRTKCLSDYPNVETDATFSAPLPPLLPPASAEGDESGTIPVAAAAAAAAANKNVKKKKPKAKNVGGWVSPELAQRLDRQWLLKPPTSVADFVPQIGDVVLYYPAGHKAFLAEFPDLLGKKTRQLTRIPLWERAEYIISEQQSKNDDDDNNGNLADNDGDKKLKARKRRSKPVKEPRAVLSSQQQETATDDDKHEEEGGLLSPSLQWWTEEWLDGMRKIYENEENEYGSYDGPHLLPILCVVQATVAEFPPDLMMGKAKVVKKEDGSQKIVFKENYASPKAKTCKDRTKLRLAVTLRPLTPIVDSSETTERRSMSTTTLPPTFAVVTFPAQSKRNFLLPFAWAYSCSHKLRVGDDVRLAPSFAAHGRPTQGRLVSCHAPKESQIHGKLALIRNILNNHSLVAPVVRSVILSSSEDIGLLSPSDFSAVLHTLSSFVASTADDDAKHGPGPDTTPEQRMEPFSALWNLICATLPIWNSFSLSSDEDEGTFRFSPWELVPFGKHRSRKNNAAETASGMELLSTSLDESLRVKLSGAIEELIQEHPSAVLFTEEVTDDIAPSYSCAVPIPMYFKRILLRLGRRPSSPKSQRSGGCCYYRTVGGLLSDVGLIRENCLLYNDPESDVADKAVDIVSSARDIISKVVRAHNKEVSEIRKADEERQRLVMLHCGGGLLPGQALRAAGPCLHHGGNGEEGTASKHIVACNIKQPFKQEVDTSWLQQIHSCHSSLETSSNKNAPPGGVPWRPQPGDRILYSRKRHAQFVRSHYQSLETTQCSVPAYHHPANQPTHTISTESQSPGEFSMTPVLTVLQAQNVEMGRNDNLVMDDDTKETLFGHVNGTGRVGAGKAKVHNASKLKKGISDPCDIPKQPVPSDGEINMTKPEQRQVDDPQKSTCTAPERPCPLEAFETPARNSNAGASSHNLEQSDAANPKQPNETFAEPEELPGIFFTTRYKEPASATKEAVANAPSTRVPTDNHDDWEEAVVQWTRASFPKIFSKKSNEDALTFETNSTLLAVGIHLKGNENLEIVYWRPCLFPSDAGISSEGTCRSCGLAVQESFMKPSISEWQPQGSDGKDKASKLFRSDAEVICRCLAVLKRKCLRDAPPSSLDEGLTKKSISEGFIPFQSRLELDMLPRYEELLLKKTRNSSHGMKNQGFPPSLSEVDKHLVDYGYVPVWLTELGLEAEDDSPDWYETISPWAKLSLELVELRLRNGYYRHREAVFEDIVEAYLSSCFLLLGRAAGRKKSPISVKRIARLAAATKSRGRPPAAAETPLSEEEQRFVETISRIRELYAAALACVSTTKSMERLFGLASSSSSTGPDALPSDIQRLEDPTRSDARKKLSHLLTAFGKESVVLSASSAVNHPSSSRQKRLRIACGGERVSIDQFFEKITKMDAVVRGKMVSVKVKTGGQEFFSVTKARCQQRPKAIFGGGEVSLRVVCDGEDIRVPELPPHSIVTTRQDFVRFQPKNFEMNDGLTSLFFGRPGRLQPCARCQVYRRSVFHCRVQRCHTKCDFDWITFFNDIGSLDRLILQVDPSHPIKETALPETKPGRAFSQNTKVAASPAADSQDGERKDTETPKEKEGGQEKRVSTAGGEVEQLETDGFLLGPSEMAADQDASDEKEEGLDPIEMLQKAAALVTETANLVREAEIYFATPDIMSPEFVEASVPVDEADGHYIYCIICGLSGDLLCCDGCPNVVHADCVGLSDVPDGEWFCEVCNMKEKCPPKNEDPNVGYKMDLDDVQLVDRGSGTNGAWSSSENTDFQKRMPFGRVEFNHDKVFRIAALLKELQIVCPHGRPIDSHLDKNAELPSNPFDALSATIKEFLQSIEIESAEALVKTCTSLIAEKFCAWREMKGMSELKNDGLKASVRKWKRKCRDVAERLGIDLQEKSDEVVIPEDSKDVESEEEKPRSRGKPSGSKSTARGGPPVDPSDPLSSLSSTARDFLSSIGVGSAAELIETKTRDLATKLGKWRKEQDMPKLKSNGEVATVSTWKSIARNAVAALEEPKTKKQEEQACARVKRAETKKQEEQTCARAKRAEKRSRQDGDPHSSPCRSSKPPSNRAKKVPQGRKALDVLSGPAREFLSSINVKSAEQFLSLRTSMVAEKLGEWRAENGLPRLQGSGNGATISAWRTLARNALDSLQTSDAIGSEEEREEENKTGILSKSAGDEPSPPPAKRPKQVAGTKKVRSTCVVDVEMPTVRRSKRTITSRS